MLKLTLTPVIIMFFLSWEVSGQSLTLYTPVSLNTPLFSRDHPKEMQLGVRINNYGLNVSFAGLMNRRILIFSIQGNNGNIKFDPLHFTKYYENEQSMHFIQSFPENSIYTELGVGYKLPLKKQKLNLILGMGRQFGMDNTRFFLQADWGSGNYMLDGGASLRGNYTFINSTHFFTLEPSIQGKIKLRDMRFVTQFGYCIAMKRYHDYMKPVLTTGLEVVIH